MIINTWALLLIGPMTPLFMLGIVIGNYHLRQLARNGGEESYPKFIKDAVQAYRDRHDLTQNND